jgi:hypothetical protein
MKKYYVERKNDDKWERSEIYYDYEDAYNEYLDILEAYRDSVFAEYVYRSTKIITVYC